jgi:hypothetical protein
MAIEVKQIEGNEIQIVLPAGDSAAQCREVGKTLLVEHNDLAIDDCAFRTKLGTRCDEVAIFGRPVQSIPGVDPRAVLVDHHL